MALAVVVSPWNSVCCESSTLNFASRRAEKAVIRKGTQAPAARAVSLHSHRLSDVPKRVNRMAAGANPKETMSASESSSTPMPE